MKSTIKALLHRLSQLIVLPLGVACYLEVWLNKGKSEVLFGLCSQTVALLPGLPGAFLRRAFYTLTLESCSPHCHIGFGTLFSHRQSVVGEHTYIGNYALMGSVRLGDHSLIGSRASILSGQALHELGDDGRWTPYSAEKVETIDIGKNVWVGEAAVISANVGEGSQIGAGAVVSNPVRPSVVVTGNPARFVRRLGNDDDTDAVSES